jgi:hypothetical protein
MWSREQLLHPATLIACAALFVSLGGVGYAAARIGTRDIQNGAVTGRKIHRGAVGAGRLANGAVKHAKLGRFAVSGDRILDGGVAGSKLAEGAVTVGKLADGAVTTGKLANGAVTNGKLANNAVSSGKLANDAVTTAKIADGAVNTNRLANEAVTTGKLADGAVSTGKLADASVTSAKLAEGTAVGGVGVLRQTRLTLRNGNAGVILMDVPFLGQLEGTCAAGIATTAFHNLSGTSVNVQATGVDNGATDRAFTDRNAPANGLTVPAPNTGNGPQEVTWQVSLGDGAGAHVATLWTTSGASLTDCVITVQALMT